MQRSSEHDLAARSTAQLIALALLDLDLLASDSRPTLATPAFAADFMRRRVAHKLVERHMPDELLVELDRRFATILTAIAERSDREALLPVVERLRTTLWDLHKRLRIE